MTGIEGGESGWIAEAVGWRRHLHQHPELAHREHTTAQFVAARLAQFGLLVRSGFAGTGVIGTLTRGTSRRSIGVRADMDALPMQEQGTVPHASKVPGVMHACGHDGHVAMALAAARVCAGLPNLDGTVHFIFQPAEEGGGGARRMVEEGLFRDFPCDVIYGLHNWPTLPLGTCVARDGAMMAALAQFEICIEGRGCHGALPHEGADCVLAGCHLVAALQSIVSRNLDALQPGVLSVTQVSAGDAWNVLPDTCLLRGTTRWFDDRVGQIIEDRLHGLTRASAVAFGCEATVRYDRHCPATINNALAARVVRATAAAPPIGLQIVDTAPSMAAEDFAFMLGEVPGCFFWLGAGNDGVKHALHSSHYDFNDDLMPHGVRLWVALIRESLAKG